MCIQIGALQEKNNSMAVLYKCLAVDVVGKLLYIENKNYI